MRTGDPRRVRQCCSEGEGSGVLLPHYRFKRQMMSSSVKISSAHCRPGRDRDGNARVILTRTRLLGSGFGKMGGGDQRRHPRFNFFLKISWRRRNSQGPPPLSETLSPPEQRHSALSPRQSFPTNPTQLLPWPDSGAAPPQEKRNQWRRADPAHVTKRSKSASLTPPSPGS